MCLDFCNYLSMEDIWHNNIFAFIMLLVLLYFVWFDCWWLYMEFHRIISGWGFVTTTTKDNSYSDTHLNEYK